MARHFKGASASNTEGSLNRIIQVIGIPLRMKGLSGSVHRRTENHQVNSESEDSLVSCYKHLQSPVLSFVGVS